ncbi:anti-sigma factor family protein [Amycolatopsis pithecellobii]|uniref:Anti-sigma factor n=1 Tax=Amycolatopsis pithecellobii TaxID=664692 RepID=A0A6N7Z487_9PSEU|nr:zf-HC2 domain-containing protein [Amycolatopsis pithecellobii]MTD53966.1 anti-sigma factor [Amycolatopsis pithecellobii]
MIGHETDSVGAYVLGALDLREMRAMERHLASCGRCQAEVTELRMARAALDGLPPEALLDGPPDGADLLLQRTLRQVRQESGREVRRGRTIAATAAVVVAAAFAGGGVMVGRAVAPPEVTQAAGTRTASGTDAATGAKMTVAVQPAAGWVRVNASVSGIPKGQKCRLYVVSRDGTREEAGSWLVAGEGNGTELDAAALVPPADVAGVEVENFDGKKYVSVRL